MEKKLTRQIGHLERVILKTRASVTTIAEITGHDFNLILLKQALDAVVNLQPILRINADESTQPIQVKEVDNPYVNPILIESDDPNEWKKVANVMMNERLPNNLTSNLFKFEILKINNDPNRTTYFYIQLSHAFSDGISGMILMNNILSFYTKFSGGEALDFNPVEFLDNLEELVFPSGKNEDDIALINQKIEKLTKENKPDLSIVKPCLSAENNTHFAILQDGTEENFQRLRNFCKQNGLTVGNVIIAAYYFATGKIGYEYLKEHDVFNLPVTFDINLRDRLDAKLGKNHVALLISVNKIYMEFNKSTTFLELCKKINKNMNDYLEKRLFLYEMEADRILYEMSTNSNSAEEETIPSFFAADLNLSSIGPYPFNPIYKLNEGEIKLKSFKCIGSPWSPKVSQYILLIHSVSYMNYSMVYSSEDNTEYAERYMRSIIDLIENSSSLKDMTFDEYLRE
jgi:NRPS condensation-like uncharacterized protein